MAAQIMPLPPMPLQRLVVLIPQRDMYKKIKAIKKNLFLQGNAGVWSFPPVIPLAKFSEPLQESALKHIAVQIRGEYTALSAAKQEQADTASRQNSGGGGQTGDCSSPFKFGDFAVTPLDGGISLWGWRLEGDLPEVKRILLETGAVCLFESFVLALGLAAGGEAAGCGDGKGEAAGCAAGGEAAGRSAGGEAAGCSAGNGGAAGCGDGDFCRPDKKFCFYTAALANMVFAPLPVGEQTYSFCWKIGKPIWLPKKAKKPPYTNVEEGCGG